MKDLLTEILNTCFLNCRCNRTLIEIKLNALVGSRMDIESKLEDNAQVFTMSSRKNNSVVKIYFYFKDGIVKNIVCRLPNE